MKASTLSFETPGAFLSYLFSIVLLSPVLKVALGGLPVVFADTAVRSIAECGVIQRQNHDSISDGRIYRSSGTIATERDRKSRNGNSQSRDDSAEDFHKSSCKTSTPRLCLRPLNAKGVFSLKTLYPQNIREEQNESIDNDTDFKDKPINFCWQSDRDESKMSTESMVSFSTQKPHTTTLSVASRPLTLRLSSDSKSQEKIGKQSLALKLDLLFATMKVRNNEIPLPQSMAELIRDKKMTSGFGAYEEDAMGLLDERFTPTTSTQSQIPTTTSIEISSRAAAKVDLTGRWRPSKTISNQDLADYDEFLKACCSDQITYWTRQLLTSYSVVSRQEFVVKQFEEEGIRLEFVDIHPLSSSVWNRTIVTNRSPQKDRLGTNTSASAANSDSNLDGYTSYVNRLKGPQGDPVLVEAYWEENGTVHTTLLRKVVNANGEEETDDQGWLQTRRYLLPLENNFETKQHEEDKEVMMVETTYHSTSYPTDIDTCFKAEQDEDKSSTKMVWRWEQVDESSG